MPPYPLIVPIVIFLFGMCVGSFLNVCIYRLPISKSIVYPPSACPRCGYQIRYYDNIPVLSYLFLRGRCRQCRVHIPVRYPLIELLSGLAAAGIYFKFGLTPQASVYYLFISILLVITFIDIDYKIIPNVISLPGIPIFFLASFLTPAVTYQESLLGILAGGGSLFLVAWGYTLMTKKEGMGGGDIKLLAMIGALLGWRGVFFTIFVSSAVGTLVGLGVMTYTRSSMKLAVPYGPFLSIGAIAYIFFGPALIYWYLTLFR